MQISILLHSLFLFKVQLITDLVTIEVRSLRRFYLLKITLYKLIFIFSGRKANILFYKFSLIVFIEIFIRAQQSLIKLTGQLSSIDSIKI